MKTLLGSKHVRTILLVDDDSDDRLLIQDALGAVQFPNENLSMVEDGEELMEYLNGTGKFATSSFGKLPDLILLDLNMPKKDGREALKEIKSNPLLRKIPVIVFTTSDSPQDIKDSYDMGANTYMAKSHTYDELVMSMKSIVNYWVDYALLTRCEKCLNG